MNRAAELVALDRALRLAQRAIERRKQVAVSLHEADADVAGLVKSVEHLAQAATREEADVDALDGVGGWVARLTGSWQHRVDQEVGEALEARHQADHATSKLADALRRQNEARATVAQLEHAEENVVVALQRKVDWLFRHSHPDAQRVAELDRNRLAAQDMMSSYDTVVRSAHAAIAALGLLEREVGEISLLHQLDNVDPTSLTDVRTWWRSRQAAAPLADLRVRLADLESTSAAAGIPWTAPQVGSRLTATTPYEVAEDGVENFFSVLWSLASADIGVLSDPDARRALAVHDQLDVARAELSDWADGLLARIAELRQQFHDLEVAWQAAVLAAGH